MEQGIIYKTIQMHQRRKIIKKRQLGKKSPSPPYYLPTPTYYAWIHAFRQSVSHPVVTLWSNNGWHQNAKTKLQESWGVLCNALAFVLLLSSVPCCCPFSSKRVNFPESFKEFQFVIGFPKKYKNAYLLENLWRCCRCCERICAKDFFYFLKSCEKRE